ESRRFLATISSAAKQMGALIDDLLAFSRIGRTPLRMAPVAQRALVDEVVAEARYATTNPKVRWTIDELPDAPGDRAMLRQVWRNLLDNAVKYSGKNDEPHIRVSG